MPDPDLPLEVRVARLESHVATLLEATTELARQHRDVLAKLTTIERQFSRVITVVEGLMQKVRHA